MLFGLTQSFKTLIDAIPGCSKLSYYGIVNYNRKYNASIQNCATEVNRVVYQWLISCFIFNIISKLS
jgi:hypothetical protein